VPIYQSLPSHPLALRGPPRPRYARRTLPTPPLVTPPTTQLDDSGSLFECCAGATSPATRSPSLTELPTTSHSAPKTVSVLARKAGRYLYCLHPPRPGRACTHAPALAVPALRAVRRPAFSFFVLHPSPPPIASSTAGNRSPYPSDLCSHLAAAPADTWVVGPGTSATPHHTPPRSRPVPFGSPPSELEVRPLVSYGPAYRQCRSGASPPHLDARRISALFAPLRPIPYITQGASPPLGRGPKARAHVFYRSFSLSSDGTLRLRGLDLVGAPSLRHGEGVGRPWTTSQLLREGKRPSAKP